MAALIKAVNAKIRSNPYTDYICSTHFWGPVSNFGIPLAAITDARTKSPEYISGPMTGVLAVYSATFMRYSMAVTPRNYLLFACHFINTGSQLVQGYRWLNYDPSATQKATDAIKDKAQEVKEAVKAVKN